MSSAAVATVATKTVAKRSGGMLLRHSGTRSLMQKQRRCLTNSKALESATVTVNQTTTDHCGIIPEKTLLDLDGPKGWPVLGNFPTYMKKNNHGRVHEVQVGTFRYFDFLNIFTSIILTALESTENCVERKCMFPFKIP